LADQFHFSTVHSLKNLLLFFTPVLIWGSTWYVIKFQVGDVHPILSVSYRFGIAGILMLIVCRWWKLNMSFSRKDHFFILLQGLFLFGFNYWLIYSSELYLTSGLVGLLFSLLVFLNLINSRIFLKTAIETNVIIGGILGLIGTGLLFRQDLLAFSMNDEKFLGIVLAISGTYVASLGNIISARNQKEGIPVIPSNAYGMTYGAAAMFFIALLMDTPVTFAATPTYIGSLFYLAILGSVVAFGAYLTLIGNIGAPKAAYVSVIAPVIALLISTLFENYQWSTFGLFGAVMILTGNVIALLNLRSRPRFPRNPEMKVPVDTMRKNLPDDWTDEQK